MKKELGAENSFDGIEQYIGSRQQEALDVLYSNRGSSITLFCS